MIVFLDAGPLSLITNPKNTSGTLAVAKWVIAMRAADHRFIVPAIADYEVGRELLRAGKTSSVAQLDAFNAAAPGRFLSVTDGALRLAAQLWARSRNAGMTTADPKELNADVMIAAQVIGIGLPTSDFILATNNIGHLSQFVPCDLWTNIRP